MDAVGVVIPVNQPPVLVLALNLVLALSLALILIETVIVAVYVVVDVGVVVAVPVTIVVVVEAVAVAVAVAVDAAPLEIRRGGESSLANLTKRASRARSRPRKPISDNPALSNYVRYGRMTPLRFELTVWNRGVNNLSSITLTTSQLSVLAKGLKFIPTPRSSSASSFSILRDFDEFSRKMRIAYQFRNHPDRLFLPRLTVRNPNWQPRVRYHPLEDYLSSSRSILASALSMANPSRHHNLSTSEFRALAALRRHPDVVIKPADKGLGLTIVDRSWYVQEAMRQLSDTSTYAEVDAANMPSIVRQIYGHLQTTLAFSALTQHLDKGIVKALLHLSPDQVTIPEFYLLIKLHKQPVVGRPIVACHSWVTTAVSTYLDYIMQPFLRNIPSYIRDSRSLVQDLDSLRVPDRPFVFFALDVESLYTNIPIREGVERVVALLREFGMKAVELKAVSILLPLVLENNYIHFGGRYFHQLLGTAMGAGVSVCFACLFMWSVERSWLDRYRDILFLYKRFIDDGFGIVCAEISDVNRMLQEFNSLHPNIRITWTVSDSSVVFLDLTIFKGPRLATHHLLDVRAYQKPINRYLYIPFSSFHPKKVKANFVKNELQRYVRNTSVESDFLDIRRAFRQRLQARGYPLVFLKPIFDSVSFADRPRLLKTRARADADKQRTPPVLVTELSPITCSLHLRSLLSLSHSKILNDSLLCQLFPSLPIVAYRYPAKLSNWLCRARFASN
eukprot:TRINITY_DN1621_c0_g1_i1.p1 TRINITY_DN1621_c0_g1~~TRINITY_DN1621_c0_g1_i1.p1  ORF type:complete len:732 (+),score=48.12 TRINITY_DN1621_c0_g1_i1:349-2544(+)